MLKQILERTTGPLTNSQFAEIMDLTMTDVNTNCFILGKPFSIQYMLQVAEISFRVMCR